MKRLECSHLLTGDRMPDFQELADEAFSDLLRKRGRPIDLKTVLRQGAGIAEKSALSNTNFEKEPVQRGPKYRVAAQTGTLRRNMAREAGEREFPKLRGNADNKAAVPAGQPASLLAMAPVKRAPTPAPNTPVKRERPRKQVVRAPMSLTSSYRWQRDLEASMSAAFRLRAVEWEAPPHGAPAA
jgi:hypothetical protein